MDIAKINAAKKVKGIVLERRQAHQYYFTRPVFNTSAESNKPLL